METLDFSKGYQEINLKVLEQTYKETTVSGDPIMGVHHYQMINKIMEICTEKGMNASIKQMFAAQNKQKGNEGVILNKELAAIHGSNAPEAHCLRRVYTTINIENFGDNESSTGIAIAFHQDGIQVAMGPLVRICTNQSILSSERMISTYGDKKIKELDKIYQIVDDWMHNFESIRKQDVDRIRLMKSVNFNYNQTMELIGRLSVIRIAHDTSNKELKQYANANICNTKQYALNQSQISKFTEGYLNECIKRDSTDMSLWDIYNIATDLYKVGTTDIPNIVPQSVKWAELLLEYAN